MDMLFVVGGIGLAFATAVVAIVVRARHHRAEDEARVAAEQEARWRAEEVRQRGEEETRRTAEQEKQRCADEETRVAAERDAKRRAEEQRAEEEARAAAEQEAQRQAEAPRCGAEDRAGVNLGREDAPGGAENGASQDDAAHIAATEETETAEACAARVEVGRADVATTSAQGAPLSVQLGAPARAPKAPRQYRPTARTPVLQRASASPAAERVARDRAVPIEVRLVFEKGGFCRVSLLPRRAAGMPVEFAVAGSGSPPDLLALQDEWYQDVALPDIGRLLSDGIEWAGALPDRGTGRLSLGGRGIYVLARHSELNGFVSTPRLTLGEEHVVLCTAERLLEVRDAIALTESPEPSLLNSDIGIPAGWVGLRGVLPRRPVAPSLDGNILDALRPLPDVEIALNGGIRIGRQTWLSGFPPTVQLLGDTSTIGVVTIDGHEAKRYQHDGYAVPGWDSPGEHTVWCTATSRTYAILGGAEDWEPWDAYAWSLGEPSAGGTQSRPAICGVLVRPPRVARPDSRPTVVAASNPILIGARPGEIEVCTPRNDVRADLCVGFPWFEPVWAIPADALHCDKRTARVLLIGPPKAVSDGAQPNTRSGARGSRRQAPAWGSHAWCGAILTAARKGLQTEPSRVDLADLWKTYKRCAKALRRGWR